MEIGREDALKRPRPPRNRKSINHAATLDRLYGDTLSAGETVAWRGGAEPEMAGQRFVNPER